MVPISFHRNVKKVWWEIIYESDTRGLRFLMAGASLLWAVSFLSDKFIYHFPTFSRPGYAGMAWLGTEMQWTVVFLTYSLFTYWCIFAPRRRPFRHLLELATNLFGFILWSYSTLSIDISLGRFSGSTSMELALCIASGLALYRTGFNDGSK